MHGDNSKNPENFEVNPLKKSGEMRELGPMEGDFAESMSGDDVPEFAGEDFGNKTEIEYGNANTKNNYYGEVTSDEAEAGADESFDNEGIKDASAILNYGLNAAAREYGVEQVVQGIKTFDATESTNPIADLYEYLGVETKEEWNDVRDEARAARPSENEFKEQSGMPKTSRKSEEGALKAIEDMKELILEVEGADPRYESLRQGAKAAGMGYFEYAVKGYGVRGMTELFEVLAAQKEEKNETKPGPVEGAELEGVSENEQELETEAESEPETESGTESGPMLETESEQKLDEVKLDEKLTPEQIEQDIKENQNV